MVKHRQLARQVGAFGDFASESSMDLDNIIFPTGSTFIFGSWICEADKQRQTSKPSPQRSRSSGKSSYFNNCNGSAHQKIRATHSIRFKSDFTTTRIRFEFRLQGEVLSECFLEAEFSFGKIPEHNPKQLGLPPEFSQEVEFFSIWARQHGKILSGTGRKIFQS